MKYFSLLFLIIALSCHQSKNIVNKKEVKETIKKKKTILKEEKSIIKTEEELIIVLKSANNITDAKALIVNSGLTWDSLIINDTTLKAALIKVPINKKDFWIERLKSSNTFSSIQVNSEKTISEIKNIAKNTFVKIRKTHCFGDCPVFDVLFFNNGNVTFNGIENVPIKGITKFKLTKEQLKKVKKYFSKTSFDTYLNDFVDKSIADLASTFITYQNKEIEIMIWENVPEELALAHEYLIKLLLQKKLIE